MAFAAGGGGDPQERGSSVWTLGGLSVTELLRRTVLESWRDDVFGQGGRMAFYQFLALFPCLCVGVTLLGHLPWLADHLNASVRDVSNQVFPARVSQLLQAMLDDYRAHGHFGFQLASVCAAAVWASHNGTWAMIYGLNRAYEVEEHRSWWQLTVTIVGLTVCLAGTVAVTVLLLGGTWLDGGLQRGGVALRVVEWLLLLACLSVGFGLLYRFGPNLRDQRWRWSTPGAACAVILWVTGTLLVRVYFEHVNDYTRSYGRLSAVAMLLIWLYISNGAVLIGGEMNSEVQKAEAERNPAKKVGRSGSDEGSPDRDVPAAREREASAGRST